MRKTMNIKKHFFIEMVDVCFILLTNVPSTFAVSCENKVRLADLQDIIKNQTKLIEDQRQVNQELSQVVEDQKNMIEKQARLIGDLKKTIGNVTSGIYFTVGLSQHKTFPEDEIIKFDKIITNVGGGYIDDNSNTDYGKFVAPQKGTYQFSASFYNVDATMGADLLKNGILITGNSNGGRGAASLSAILDLNENDEVHLLKPHWVGDEVKYNHFFTSFSGALLHAK